MDFFDKLRESLDKTRRGFTEKIEELITGFKSIDEDLLEELEAVLLQADIGVKTTTAIMSELRKEIKARKLETPEELRGVLADKMVALLGKGTASFAEAAIPPTVIMVVGVNGVGKTTTIGKLGHRFRQEGKRVLLAAGDTFRAAAIDQLAIWGRRIGAEVIRHSEGADPAAVAFDALQAARARKSDVVIVDTAGRLHTKANLMEELKKVRRVIEREIPGAPHEVLLVLDATTGQNALAQARLFQEVAGVTGVALTKLDGTAKGGIVVAVKAELSIPVKLIGIGEGMDDLRPFVPEEFAAALFDAGK